jgi:hypothetical protein
MLQLCATLLIENCVAGSETPGLLKMMMKIAGIYPLSNKVFLCVT